LRLDFPTWGMHGPIHLAAERGWFKDADLDVVIQDGAGSGNTIQLVGSGQIDVGWVQLGVAAIARNADLPVTSFVGIIRKGDLAVLVDESSGIRTAKDLKGKKISVVTGGPWTPYIPAYLKSGGLDPSQVDIVSVAPPAMIPTYAVKNMDGFMAPAPWGIPLVQGTRPARALLLADANIVFPSYGLITTDATLANKRDALRRLAAVFVKAWSYTYDGHVAEAVQAIIKQRPNAKLDPAVLRGQLTGYKDFLDSVNTVGKPMGWQSEQDWREALDAMVSAGVIKSGRTPSEFFTNDLLPK